MQKGVILGCGNRSNVGINTVSLYSLCSDISVLSITNDRINYVCYLFWNLKEPTDCARGLLAGTKTMTWLARGKVKFLVCKVSLFST
jgi:hypothetical protein